MMMLNKNLTPVYTDAYISIAVDFSTSFLQSTWLTHPDAQQFMAGFQRVADLVKQNKIKYWLSDSRQLLYLDKASQNWMKNIMLPQSKDSVLLKYARIVSPETLNSFDTEDIFNYMDNHPEFFRPIQIGVFTSVYQALSWIEIETT
jgi:hypothetical protein